MKKPATAKRSLKELLMEHGLDVLLIFIPAAVILHYTRAAEFWVFIASGLAIVPLAGWMGKATEALAETDRTPEAKSALQSRGEGKP